MESLESNNKRFFPQLTGVRAMAAYMIYLFHHNPFNTSVNPSFAGRFIGELSTSLSIFFVLSGFLIYYRYEDSVSGNGKGWYQYIANRVARIYPIYFLFTTLTFIIIYSTYHFEFTKLLGIYLTNISFVRGFFDELKFTGISQGWSLTVEECFYFLAPLIFISLKKVNVLFQPVIIILTGCLIVYLLGTTRFYGFMKSYYFMMKYTFFGRCIEFYVGIYIGILFKRKIKNGFLTAGTKSLYTYGSIGLMIACMACFALITQGIEPENKFWVSFLLNSIIMNAAIGIFFFGLLTETSFVRRVLSNPLSQLLGKSSYVFYLIHMGLIHDLIASSVPGSGLISKIALFIVLNVISIIVFRLIEEPLNKGIRKALLRKTTASN